MYSLNMYFIKEKAKSTQDHLCVAGTGHHSSSNLNNIIKMRKFEHTSNMMKVLSGRYVRTKIARVGGGQSIGR